MIKVYTVPDEFAAGNEQAGTLPEDDLPGEGADATKCHRTALQRTALFRRLYGERFPTNTCRL